MCRVLKHPFLVFVELQISDLVDGANRSNGNDSSDISIDSGARDRDRDSSSIWTTQAPAIQFERLSGSFRVKRYVHHIRLPSRPDTKSHLSTQYQGTEAINYDLYAVATHDRAGISKDGYVIYAKTSQGVWYLYKSGEGTAEVGIKRALVEKTHALLSLSHTNIA
ncbi:hypothetical protein EV178_003724 [Coemansia sp. RSA 1646]|nr:hypothetical protein EV178_003724 [Coemansia sp. RSA 1646]